MIDLLYPVSYLLSLSGLIGWFYVQDNKRRSRQMSKLFLLGFFVYLVTLGAAQATLSFKLFVLFRDLVVLGLVSQFFSFFRKYKVIFFGMLFALYGLFGAKGMDILQQTFPEKGDALNAKGTLGTTEPSIIENTKPTTTDNTNLDPEGELLVEIREGHSISEIANTLDKYGITYQRAFQPQRSDFTDLDDYFVLNIPDNQVTHLATITNELSQSPLVDWVEGNEEIQISPIESDKLSSPIEKKYGINDPGVEQLWAFDAMNVDLLYKSIQSGKVKPQRKAVIAILDTGVDAKHEDLAGNFQSINTKYDRDKQGHGTHCAGIAGSVSNNGLGVASLSQNNEFVKITSIQVLNSFGMGTQKKALAGIIEAADNQVDVISMSFGGRSDSTKQRAFEQAVKYANDAGAIVVVSAGNSNANAKDFSPANVEGVITVSAVDQQLKRAVFSNYVDDIAMGIAAPGVDIYSSFPNNKYQLASGTSMATPYVSGLVGVMKSINPTLNTSEIYQILKDSGMSTNNVNQTGNLIQPELAIGKVVESL